MNFIIEQRYFLFSLGENIAEDFKDEIVKIIQFIEIVNQMQKLHNES